MSCDPVESLDEFACRRYAAFPIKPPGDIYRIPPDVKIGILMERSGLADLSLHGGRVPLWLAERMTKLGTAITESILHQYGTSGLSPG